jgi:uncharacterized membrane protein YphA (DoxX/SURF4 family)
VESAAAWHLRVLQCLVFSEHGSQVFFRNAVAGLCSISTIGFIAIGFIAIGFIAISFITFLEEPVMVEG